MPVTKSAKKKLRKDIKRERENSAFEKRVDTLIKKAGKKPSEKTIKEAFSAVDRSVKKHIIHKNKAARLKSRLSKLIITNPAPRKTKAAKKTAKK